MGHALATRSKPRWTRWCGPYARTLLSLALLAAADTPWSAGATRAARPDPTSTPLHGDLLARHTRPTRDLPGTVIDYARLQDDAERRRLIASLADFDPRGLPDRDARHAFWIDTYDILAIQTALSAHPVASIEDVGSFFRPVWNREAGTVGGRGMKLDEIEHEILRPMGEPRMRFAIVCGSRSCPSLARTPFIAAQQDAQLEASLHGFLRDTRKGLRIDPARDRVRVSRIFDWLSQDFDAHGGIVTFIDEHARHEAEIPGPARAWLARHGRSATFEYFDYDWALNEAP